MIDSIEIPTAILHGIFKHDEFKESAPKWLRQWQPEITIWPLKPEILYLFVDMVENPKIAVGITMLSVILEI